MSKHFGTLVARIEHILEQEGIRPNGFTNSAVQGP